MVSFLAVVLKTVFSFLNQKILPNHCSALIGLYIDFSSISGTIQLFVPHWPLTTSSSSLHSDIEVDHFHANVPVDNKFFGLDVPVGDIELVKICDTLDEAPADLSDFPIGQVPARQNPANTRFAYHQPAPHNSI